eukprot:CAMPEP_0182420002 /NCGR_PEP_ID=MMETSP1167-20130531/4473_1 /TAXON_ID=2988 /ORGANISM="Mallomonas Sp, Strain CCMP3275" /LENGTH=166 /DNA_ID=CAMNT_0024595345 /DNA_START=162 /DNA_END=662 /DNA_ORIENTATION=-
MDMANSRIEGNKDKKFGEMIDLMVKTPKWTLKPWKETMESQLSSWIMYVPGVGTSDEVKNIKKFKEMLDCMTPQELETPESIGGKAKERIAVTSSHPVEDVSRMLMFFKHSLVLHTWLHMKKTCKEEMPKTEEEIVSMQESDPRIQVISRKIIAPKKSGRGRRTPF